MILKHAEQIRTISVDYGSLYNWFVRKCKSPKHSKSAPYMPLVMKYVCYVCKIIFGTLSPNGFQNAAPSPLIRGPNMVHKLAPNAPILNEK